jgi:hypothetical protein
MVGRRVLVRTGFGLSNSSQDVVRFGITTGIARRFDGRNACGSPDGCFPRLPGGISFLSRCRHGSVRSTRGRRVHLVGTFADNSLRRMPCLRRPIRSAVRKPGLPARVWWRLKNRPAMRLQQISPVQLSGRLIRKQHGVCSEKKCIEPSGGSANRSTHRGTEIAIDTDFCCWAAIYARPAANRSSRVKLCATPLTEICTR